APHLRRRALPRARQAGGLAPMPGAAVLGAGFAVPEREVLNHEFAARLDTSDEWIVSRTGIRARRTLEGSGLATSDLAVAAARADRAVATGAMGRVLLIGADALTRHVDWEDRATAILFGDGAGAVVLGPGGGLLGTHLGADGRRAGDIRIAAGGSRRPVDQAAIAARLHKIAMNGPEVFRAAVEAMADALAAASERAGVRPTDLRWVFAHQANARIVRR